MTNLLIILLTAIILMLTAYVFVLRNKVRQTSRTLKELIKENDGQQSNPGKTNGDIYFKVDKNFEITFINDSGADILGHTAYELKGKSVFGTLVEDKGANRQAFANALSKMCRNQSTINTQIVLLKGNGQKQLMLCREWPLLNEILECEGISFLCKDLSEAKAWEENLNQFQHRDIFTNGLNEQALLERFEHDFKLAKRYNKDFSCVTVELRDIYDFISRGIDFETADKLLKVMSDVCFSNLTPNANIGRVDKTKIVMVLNGTNREKALAIAQKIMKESVPAIRQLGVDEYNAQMIVITYSDRKNVNDTFESMWSRLRRHIKTALKNREYGVISSELRGKALPEKQDSKI